MAEIKKIWLVHDYPGMDVNDLFTDPAIRDEEHRLQQLMGDPSGYSPDTLFRIVFGTGIHKFFAENPKLYDDAASARKDAESRVAKARAKYERTKTAGSTDPLVERVLARHVQKA
jgi:hypothetical protein